MSLSSSLRKAAQLQEKIETLRAQLASVLTQARAEVEKTPVTDVVSAVRRKPGRPPGRPKLAEAHRNGGRVKKAPAKMKMPVAKAAKSKSPLKGKKRSASPSGPLAPAVVKVLQAQNKAMNVRDILEGLTQDGYRFTSPEPKKNLAARIYRLKGVRQVGEGLFAVA